MIPTALDQRLVRGLAGTLYLDPADPEGMPLDVTGPVTVTVADHTGALILEDEPATLTAGRWTVPVTPAHTAELARWTCLWTDAATASTWTTTVEVAGAHLVTAAELYRSDPTIEEASIDELATARLVAEVEAEWICAVAFTPRLRVATFDGNDDYLLDMGDHACRALRSVSIDDVDQPLPGRIELGEDGTLWNRTDSAWPAGRSNITVVWEAGLDRPAPDLRDALALRVRLILQRPQSNIPLQAIEWGNNGDTMKLDRASKYSTGIPDVDAVYARHSRRTPPSNSGGSEAPAYGRLDLDPSRSTLFHGGPR